MRDKFDQRHREREAERHELRRAREASQQPFPAKIDWDLKRAPVPPDTKKDTKK